MKNLTIVTAKGFTKEEALASINTKLDVKFDATVAWKKEGEPEGKYLEAFADKHIETKLRGAAGIGYSVTVDAGSADTRERPYKVLNVVTDGQRKFKTVYEGLINVAPDGTGGTIVLVRDTKGEAEDAAKDYVTEHKVDVKVRIAKNVIEGQEEALTVEYTPSINTKLGTYIFFGYEG